VGGKNASLGEMYQELTPQGVKVPNGFAITADAYCDIGSQHLLSMVSKSMGTAAVCQNKSLRERQKTTVAEKERTWERIAIECPVRGSSQHRPGEHLTPDEPPEECCSR